MSDWIPRETLQGTSGPLGAILATWLIWPILCGLIGLRKGELGRGALHGLLWGPFGLIFVLLAQRKYVCPTCGQKTLKTPHSPDVQPLNVELPAPTAFATPDDIRTVARPVEAPPATGPRVRPSVRPLITAERRETAPMSPEDREKIVAAACAGYDDEEIAHLRSWLNNE